VEGWIESSRRSGVGERPHFNRVSAPCLRKLVLLFVFLFGGINKFQSFLKCLTFNITKKKFSFKRKIKLIYRPCRSNQN
jgi:hypothetical protein